MSGHTISANPIGITFIFWQTIFNKGNASQYYYQLYVYHETYFNPIL